MGYVLVLILWVNGVPGVHQLPQTFDKESECTARGVQLVAELGLENWLLPGDPVALTLECREQQRSS